MKFLLKHRFSYLDVTAVMSAVLIYNEGSTLLALGLLLMMVSIIVVLEKIFLEN